MTERAGVIADGVDSSPDPRRSRPSWLLGVVGFALGLGLGVVVVSPGATQGPGTTISSEPVGEPALVEEVGSPGVVGAIPGFPDAIVAIARAQSTALNYVLWPPEGSVRVQPLSGGHDVALDVSSRFIAMTNEVPGLAGALLSVGRVYSIQPAVTEVVSYAWHDSESALLGFSRLVAGGTRLFAMAGDLKPVEVTDLLSPEDVLVGWGDWGWAIQREQRIELLTPDGEFKDSEVGRAYATHGSGWIFAVEGDQAKLVSGGGGVRRIHAPLKVGVVVDAAFSPDGSLVAVAGRSGVAVLDVVTAEIRKVSDSRSRLVTWSSDSRFVLTPAAARSGVVVIDIEQPGVSHTVLRSHSVVTVGALPLLSS